MGYLTKYQIMKFFYSLVLLGLTGYALAEDSIAAKAAKPDDCQKKTGVDKSLAQKLLLGDFSVRDEPIKCYAKCYANKKGFVSVDGEIVDDVVKSLLKQFVKEEVKIDMIITTCKMSDRGDTPCDYPFNAFECFWIEVKKTFSGDLRAEFSLLDLKTADEPTAVEV